MIFLVEEILKILGNKHYYSSAFLLLNFLFLSVCSASYAAQTSTSSASAQPAVVAKDDYSAADSITVKKDTVASDSSVSDTIKKTQVDTIRYEANNIEYNVEKKTLYLKGRAIIHYQNITLFADTIVYLTDQDLFVARGSPQLVEGTDTTIGEEMSYNIKTRRGKVSYASTHFGDGFFNGHNVVKQENNDFYVHQGDFTTCAYPQEPHYFFYGKHTKVVLKDKIITRPVIFNIADVPVAALPYFIFPLERGRRSGFLTPVFGGHPGDKGYLDNIGYYFAINDYCDAKIWARVDEFSDWAFGAAGQYILKYWLNGSIVARYAQTGEFLTKSREWSIDYAHSQNLTPDGLMRLDGKGSLVSSRVFYTDISKDTADFLNPDVRATMTLLKRFESINASASATLRREHKLKQNDIADDIPSVSFSLPSRPLFAFKPSSDIGQRKQGDKEIEEPKWYNKIYFDYEANGLIKRQKYGADYLDDFVAAAIRQRTSVSSPQTVLKWFTINPNFSARLSTFDAFITTTEIDTVKNGKPVIVYDTLRDFGNFRAHNAYGWNAGLSLSTKLYGIFPIKVLNLTGIRHLVSPSVGYTFTPKYHSEYRYLPLIDYERNHDRSQVVTFNLGNQFDCKTLRPPKKEGEKPIENKFNLFNVNVSSSYNFEAKQRKWSDLFISASTNFRRISLSYGSAYWLYDIREQTDDLVAPILRSYSVSVNLAGGIAAAGTLWDGDKFVLETMLRDDITDEIFQNRGARGQSWQLNISPSYEFSSSRSSPSDIFVSNHRYILNASTSLGYSRKWSLSWGGYYNFSLNQLVGHSVNLNCDLECWEMRFNWRPSGVNPGYYFIVNIKRIPEIKWEQKS